LTAPMTKLQDWENSQRPNSLSAEGAVSVIGHLSGYLTPIFIMMTFC